MPTYYKELPATISSTNQESDAINIKGQKGISIELPTFTVGLNTAAAAVSLKGSEDSDGTFRPIYMYSAASGYNAFGIPSGAGNYTVVLNQNSGFLPGFIKVCVSGTNATATAAGYAAVVHMYI